MQKHCDCTHKKALPLKAKYAANSALNSQVCSLWSNFSHFIFLPLFSFFSFLQLFQSSWISAPSLNFVLSLKLNPNLLLVYMKHVAQTSLSLSLASSCFSSLNTDKRTADEKERESRLSLLLPVRSALHLCVCNNKKATLKSKDSSVHISLRAELAAYLAFSGRAFLCVQSQCFCTDRKPVD